MLKKVVILFFLINLISYSQIENIKVGHPVYKFLLRLENLGLTEDINLNDLPLQKKDILFILNNALNKKNNLKENDIIIINRFLKEFENNLINSTELIPSKSDSNQIFFDNIFSDKEKHIFLYRDSNIFTSIKPLASLDFFYLKNDTLYDNNYSLIGNLGIRLSGSIDNLLGYNLQATNGTLITGNRNVAITDNNYAKNVKFIYYNSDIDFTESHIILEKDWFTAYLGRESRLIGSGFYNHLIVNDNSTPFDMLSLKAKFKGFTYKFSHNSLIGFINKSGYWETGFNISIIPKYMVFHKFSINGNWGEFSFYETVVYSNRNIDLAYLNPLSFLKSLEHALRDRDNSGMGLDLNLRFLNNFQLKANYFLDDIRFEMIGKNYWGNKSSFNIGLAYSNDLGFDIKTEYVRIEPFTYSHFNRFNSMMTDGFLYSSYLYPNSDRITIGLDWWFLGGRYPLEIQYSYTRHGKNIIDEQGNIIKNVGGDPNYTKEYEHPGIVYFLDGDLETTNNLNINYTFELIRQFALSINYNYLNSNELNQHFLRFKLVFEDF